MEKERYIKIFDKYKKWYKGNLHTHCTYSDGYLTEDEVIARYKELGYDFIALTDHRVYYPGKVMDDFIVLPGEEFMHEEYEEKAWTAYHIIGIGTDSEFETTNDTDPQDIVDGIKQRNGLCVMGHPAWSIMSPADIKKLNGIDATEIYSTISEMYSNRGDSSETCDRLANDGMPLLLFAVDDMHFNKLDIGRGFIRLQTDDFSQKGIMKALYNGDFYASQGPCIYSIEVRNDELIVETSPMEVISIMSNRWFDWHRVTYREDEPLTRLVYKIGEKDTWLRVHGKDKNGLQFWSNYIILDK